MCNAYCFQTPIIVTWMRLKVTLYVNYLTFTLFIPCLVNWLTKPFRANKCTVLLLRISLLFISYMLRLNFHLSCLVFEKMICLCSGSTNRECLCGRVGTAVAQYLRCCATNRKVTGSIPDGVIGIFHWHNPSDRAMVLGSTQPPTEMRTRRISWG